MGSHAIDTPMQEDTELIVLKFLACLQVLGSRSIRLRQDRHTGNQAERHAACHSFEILFYHNFIHLQAPTNPPNLQGIEQYNPEHKRYRHWDESYGYILRHTNEAGRHGQQYRQPHQA